MRRLTNSELREGFEISDPSRPSPSTVTDEGLVETVAAAIYAKLTRGRLAEELARAALEASGHTALLRAAQKVVDRRVGLVPGYCSPGLSEAIDELDAALSRPLDEKE